MSEPQLITYRKEYAQAFADLNYRWIEHYFEIEEEDRKALDNPEGYALSKGGQIFFVVIDGEPVGTVAMVPHAWQGEQIQSFELAKMAVQPGHQGRGLSRLLMQACIEFAKAGGAQEVMLVTNDVLTPAVTLYEKFGFQAQPVMADQRYSRGNLQMVLRLDERGLGD